MDDDMKMLRLGKRLEELKEKAIESKQLKRIEEERERKRAEREMLIKEARFYFVRKLEDAMIKLDRMTLIGRFTRCLIRIFTK